MSDDINIANYIMHSNLVPVYNNHKPKLCPSCVDKSHTIHHYASGITHCPSGWSCDKHLHRSLSRLLSDRCMDVPQLTSRILKRLITLDIVTDACSLFTITIDDLASTGLCTQMHGNSIIRAIFISKTRITFGSILYALYPRSKFNESLVSSYPFLEDMLLSTIGDLVTKNGMDPSHAVQLTYAVVVNYQQILELTNLGVGSVQGVSRITVNTVTSS